METPWIKHPLSLNGQIVDLLPLEERHFEELEKLAADKRIWQFYTLDGTDAAEFRKSLIEALTEREQGRQYPFVIFHKSLKKIVGATRFLDLQPKNRKLEIGWTWLHPDHWATAVNTECKLLLLGYCFETLRTIRVQLKTSDKNERSRKAIARLGAEYEGILRNDLIRYDGSYRNSVYFSIIESEWPEKKELLQRLYNKDR